MKKQQKGGFAIEAALVISVIVCFGLAFYMGVDTISKALIQTLINIFQSV